MKRNPMVLIMAGGTGGHVFPALAVARAVQERGVTVRWLGTRRGLEARLVPAAGIPIDWISIAGLRGKRRLSLIFAPVRLAIAVLQAIRVILLRRPDAVLGMGGFAAGPGGIAAFLLRRPLVIHEQNAIAGLTNRILARFATHVFSGFAYSFSSRIRAHHVGNPVRCEIAALPQPRDRLAGRDGRLRLLVIGGSQGAQALNRTLPRALALLPAEDRPRVRHQCGTTELEPTRAAYQALDIDADLTPFIDDMANAYAWADLVLSRAGALTLAELTAAGVAALLVPYPHAVDDHQTHNAKYLLAAGAAHLLPQHALTPESLAAKLQTLLHDRTGLLRMAIAARSLALTDATEHVANTCVNLATKRGRH